MKKSTLLNLVLTLVCCVNFCLIIPANGQVIAYLKPTKVQNIENFSTWRFTGISFARSPLVYPYNFTNPVRSVILCDTVLQTGDACDKTPANVPTERYFTAGFGPRMTVTNPVITRQFDFHLGADIIDRTQTKTTAKLPEIKCMCDGKVDSIDNVNNSSHGLSVKVKCNDIFQGMGTTNWGNIYMAYRHLKSINTNLVKGMTVKKGDVIGIMGNTGTQSGNNHLHLSLQRKEDSKFYNVHPMRAFNPAKNPHLIKTLDNSEIEIHFLNINTWKSDGFVIFRIAVPHFQANLEMISLRSGTITKTFDIEQRSLACHDDTTCLDDNSFDGMELFVFPFTRLDSLSALYTQYKTQIDAVHFAGNKYPIKTTGVFQKSAYAIDIKTTLGTNSNIKTNGIEIYVSDIWGQGVRGIVPANGL